MRQFFAHRLKYCKNDAHSWEDTNGDDPKNWKLGKSRFVCKKCGRWRFMNAAEIEGIQKHVKGN